MNKVMYVLICISLFSVNAIQAQTIVEAGDDLVSIISNAANGDEIVIKPGIHKANYTNVSVTDKNLYIHGEPGSPRPKVYIKEIAISGNDINLTLEHLEISGATIDSLTNIEDLETLSGNYVYNLTSDFVSGGDLIIRDCILRNFTRCVVRGDRAENTVGKILIDDCIITDLRGGSSYGPFRLKSRILFDEFTIQNTTFYKIQGTLIDCKDMSSHSTDITLNHCTMYEWGGVIDNKYLFEITQNDQARLKITNSILAKTNNPDSVNVYGFRILDAAYYAMTFSALSDEFSVDDSTFSQVNWDLADYVEEDYPVPFTHPDTGNFMIPRGDNMYLMSDQGTLIGDPRWADLPDAIGSVYGQSSFTVYPNPADQELYLIDAGAGTLEIINSVGMKMEEYNLFGSPIQIIDISKLPPGLYFISLNNITKQILVQ